ncbi:hypothetical protein B0H16DRAFT_1593758, partial [Mycena metata]
MSWRADVTVRSRATLILFLILSYLTAVPFRRPFRLLSKSSVSFPYFPFLFRTYYYTVYNPVMSVVRFFGQYTTYAT